MSTQERQQDDLYIRQENRELRLRLEEAEETLRAIREGEVDGLIINGSQGEQVFTLVSADYPYRMLIEQMNEGAVTLSQDGIILYCNPSFARITKTPLQELIGKPVFCLIHPDDRFAFQADFDLKDNTVQREINLMRGNGSSLPVYLSINLMWVEGAPCLAMVVTDLSEIRERASALQLANRQLQQEITERRQMEDALRQSEEKFAKAFHYSPMSMAIEDKADNRYIDVNESWLSTFGLTREEAIGRTHRELNLFCSLEDLLVKGLELEKHKRLHNYEILFWNRHGESRIGMASSETIQLDGNECYLHTMTDITEQKQIEKEMVHLDRLNMIGEMAASIGHEIRNPMTAIRGFLQMLNSKDCYVEDRVFFDLMIEELDRANDIITEYLGMAKDKKVDLQVQYLDEVVKSLYPMIQADANYKEMDVQLKLGKPPMPLIDANEIRQLLLNMSRNGLEAMSSGGILTIGTSALENEIILFIKDQGCGLDPNLIDKIGTPFFTTKEQGTGLGLAVCYSIAARHNARIDFETGPEGTTFYVRFPMPLEQGLLF